MNHFFAVPLPDEICEELGERAEDWRSMNQLRASWYGTKDFHFTLKFLGDVDTGRQAELIEAAMPVAAQTEPFTVDLNASPGAFSSLRAPRVLWAGVKESEPMALLAGCLEAAMEPLGLQRERRPFKAHITLARCRDISRDAEQLNVGPRAWTLGLPKERLFPIFTADQFVLMQTLSQKERQTRKNAENARYTIVRTFPFGLAKIG